MDIHNIVLLGEAGSGSWNGAANMWMWWKRAGLART